MTSRTEGVIVRTVERREPKVGGGGGQNKEVQRNEREFTFNVAEGEESDDASGLNLLCDPIRSTPVASDFHGRKTGLRVETRRTEDV